MVKKLSDSIALKMSNELNFDKDKEAVMSYGLEIVLGGIFKIVTLLLLSWILGIFSYTMAGMLTFSLIRPIIGGTHADTYEKCFVVSIGLLLLIGALGKYLYFLGQDHFWLAYVVYGLAVSAVFLWVPAGTEKKTIKRKALRYKMKLSALILLTVWIALILWSQNTLYSVYTFSSILGVFSAFLLLTPPAYRLMKKI